MNYEIWFKFLVQILLQIQVYESEGRYCRDAVASAALVASCPTSKTEWDTAARRKNCSRIASYQNCSTEEKFQYHCVINGFRNETLEVCAPSRTIFGHCVEFNLLGGVIQDQLSTPCNDVFPKCDDIYISTAAYTYPDCYDLISKFSTKVYTTTNINYITTTPTIDKSRDLIAVMASAAGTVAILIISISIVVFICKHKRQNNKKKMALANNNALTDASIEHDNEADALKDLIRRWDCFSVRLQTQHP
eukprot:XP_019917950.1 PREDICTED: uncharacterized protein LOC105348391 [Crassostrea gigas]